MANLDLFRELASEGYHPTSVPGPRDSDLASALSQINSPPELQSAVVEIDLSVARLLIAFASRMAVLALRRRDQAWIRYGLLAAQLAMAREDSRDVVSSYAVLFRSAQELGGDAGALFRELSYLAEGALVETPAQFASRSSEQRDIGVFGMRLVADRHGWSYRPGNRGSR